MPVMVTSKFDEGPIKNEYASLAIPFSHLKSMGNFLNAQGHLTLKGVVRSGQNLNSSKILPLSSLPASLKKIWSKTIEKRWRHLFPHCTSKAPGAFCYHGNQSIDQICPKASPHPSDATYKIWSRLANWPQRYSSLKVWTTDRWRRKIIGIL